MSLPLLLFTAEPNISQKLY